MWLSFICPGQTPLVPRCPGIVLDAIANFFPRAGARRLHGMFRACFIRTLARRKRKNFIANMGMYFVFFDLVAAQC